MSSHFLRSGTGRHRLPKNPKNPKKTPLLRGVSTTSVIVAATTSVLCGAGTAQADDDEPERSGPVAGRNVGLLVIDNSHADSWLEIDRTLNTLFRSKGTAGSDHDGGGGAIDVQTGDVSGPGPGPGPGPAAGSGSGGVIEQIGQIGHPPYQGENGE
ncbi:hypothetical protein ACFXBB_10835 [Streptomyces scopuliridis]|uniref:hypothetical protein n=1 Tax=Streptomyces scopuliridis TaxID=452529 RepID=UPI0036C34B94